MNDKAAARLGEAFAALELGQPDRAERLLQGLLRKTPRHFDALVALGAVRGQQGRLDDAAALFERAVRVRPDNADAHYNLGVALAHLGSRERAIDCYRNALRTEPRHLNACNNLAAELIALDRPNDALACIEQGLAHHPGDAQLLSKRGAALKDLGHTNDAIDAFKQVVRMQPNDAIAHGNLGLALRKAGRLDEAIRSFEQAVSLGPRSASHHSHLGLALADSGRVDDALASLRRAVALDPDSAEIRENLGLILLLQGEFKEGWTQYEYRHHLPRFKSRRPPIDAPLWQGEPLTNKSILVHAEQGLGDTIQFARYVPLLANQGASVTFAVQPTLIPTLSALSKAAAVIPAAEVRSPFDYQIALLSLPRAFGTTLSTIPSVAPYLSVDEDLVERWRERVGVNAFKIGIVWQGNPGFQHDHGRSIPLAEFAPLAAIPGVRLISLQKGFGAEQIAAVDFRACIQTLDEPFGADRTVTDTAAVMVNLDLIVTSDTMIAHLAGALACPTLVALRRTPDWRWLLDRDDCPWYPTARLVRQRSDGDWRDVFVRIAADVRARKLRGDNS